MSKWEKNILGTTEMVEEYPQVSYAVVVCLVQLEWIFLERVKKDTGYTFAGVDKLLWETFLPYLFFGNRNLSHPF